MPVEVDPPSTNSASLAGAVVGAICALVLVILFIIGIIMYVVNTNFFNFCEFSQKHFSE